MNTIAAPTLEAVQIEFQRHLLGQPSGVAESIRAGGAIDVPQRLAIYHHAYRARLLEALRDSFGHTLLYLGDEGFDGLAAEFVEATPSSHPNLRWYGRGFPDWLARRLPLDPDVAELAALDAALRAAFDAADAPAVTLEQLGALPAAAWDGLGFRFQPACARLRLACNTLAIWHALDSEAVPPAAQRLDEPTELLVWRVEMQPHFRSLGALEVAALDALLAGRSFAATCELLAERFADIDTGQQAGALLRRWVDEGLMSGVQLDDEGGAARG